MTQRHQTKECEIPESLIKKWRKDILSFSPVIKINSKGENVLGHTAPFPEDIPEMAVLFYSYPEEIVLDPFAGSFTTAITASKYKRIGIGIELNKHLFRESVIKILRKEVSQIDIYGSIIKKCINSRKTGQDRSENSDFKGRCIRDNTASRGEPPSNRIL